MQITSGEAKLLEHYLSLAAAQLKSTAGNMANVDTPGFRTKGFDFAALMRKAVSESDNANAPDGEWNESPALDPIDGLVSRPDGNNVSMDREGMKMADAQLKFRVGVALLKQQFTQIADAIHSDTK